MPEEQLRYDRMVERALRGVVRDALRLAARRGLPGDHHFYITYSTGFPGVEVPQFLLDRYPSEMTIVLQYQFYGLEVSRDEFSVTLSFSGKHERLRIPLAAITTFADPSVNFALQFQTVEESEDDLLHNGELLPVPGPEGLGNDGAPVAEEGAADDEGDGGKGKIVTLDSFRKK